MKKTKTATERKSLAGTIESLAPWHMAIQLDDELNTGDVFSPTRSVSSRENDGVGLLDLHKGFMRQLDSLYPDGLKGKRFLDCACNAGGYCFWATEREVDYAFGFDVRDHWIDQARFVQQHRTVASTDNIEFTVADLLDLASFKLEPFDFTMFKGIFYHLPDPIASLKLAADLTTDVMIVNTAALVGDRDGYLRCKIEGDELMSGVHGLSWYPTGPVVVRQILRYCGFKEFRLTLLRKPAESAIADIGRLEIIAAKEEGRLDGVPGKPL